MKSPSAHFNHCPSCGDSDPAIGKWAPPGGFADVGENAEAALSREVMEEVGLQIDHWKYLHSAVNYYTYKKVTYPVLDFFYTTNIKSVWPLSLCPQETLSAEWIRKETIRPESLAFPSMQEAFVKFLVGTHGTLRQANA